MLQALIRLAANVVFLHFMPQIIFPHFRWSLAFFILNLFKQVHWPLRSLILLFKVIRFFSETKTEVLRSTIFESGSFAWHKNLFFGNHFWFVFGNSIEDGVQSWFLIPVLKKDIFLGNDHFVLIVKTQPKAELPKIGDVFFLSFSNSLTPDKPE